MSEVTGRQRVSVQVPGKINLQLSVGPRREDGYHELVTVFQAVSLYDIVHVEPAKAWSVSVSGPQSDSVPVDGSNIALQAAQALAQRALKILDADATSLIAPVSITIEKQIPVAAGMAGGSADAAATLVACAHLWGLEAAREDLEVVAGELGADVPFLLHGGTAVGTGRGDDITPVLAQGEAHWVLWLSEGEGLSTPAVYAEFDRLHEQVEPPAPELSPELVAALRTMDPVAMGPALHNNLTPASLSLQPALQDVLDAGRELGALGALVSGSGPTVAFLVGSQAGALDLSMGLAARGPGGDIIRVTGPVPGAHVIDSRGRGSRLGSH